MRRKQKLLSLIILLLAGLWSTQAAIAAGDSFTVVIDAGHGGHDTGAVDNGTREKDVNLGVALKLGKLIEQQMKDAKVVYTRDNDTFRTLQERADIANKAKGNIFISIHTNSVDKSNRNRNSVAGASVYALGLHKDGNNMNVARRENSVIQLESDFEEKYQGFDPDKDESYIIFELAQKKNLSKSIGFANSVQKQLVDYAGRKDRGVHQAGFWVLWATSMPAVLIELDFICNPESAKFISSEGGQQKLAGAIFKALSEYKNKETHGRTAVKPSPKQRQLEQEAESKRNKTKENDKKPHKSSKDKHADPDIADDNSIYALAASSGNDIRIHTYTPPKGKPATRRRRSESGRQASVERNVETASIPLHTESERASVKVDNSGANTSLAAKGEGQSKASKSKTQKKEKKDRKKQHKSKVQRLSTFYSIQILASSDQLTQNNPRFKGLKPISMFKENNLYKYTYGESADRKAIEATLKRVKEDFPDAFIIETKKNVTK